MKLFYLYKIKVNKFSYYGITSNPKERKNRHLNELNKNKHHNIILQRSFNKQKNFNFEILHTVNTQNEVYKLEKEYILTKECVNLTKGGDGGDTISNHPSKNEIIEKIKNTKNKIEITLSDDFLKNQGNIKKYSSIVWGNYICPKCKKVIKGKSNFLRYHGNNGEICGLPTKKHFNNGTIQKFMYEDEPKGKEWVRGKLKKHKKK
jgi:hypothetical protein